MTTKTAQFTPGPWSINEVRNEPEKLSIVDADMCFVADIWQTYMDGKSRQQDNATLIAAAPAMYEALQNLLEWAKGNRGAREGNPYCKPEVRQALKVLASIQGKKDYLDADTVSQAEGR